MKIDPLKRGVRMITGDCSQCPYEKLLSYPVSYCLFGVVDYSTRCPFDYDLKLALQHYAENKECADYHYNIVKKYLNEDLEKEPF